MAVQFTQLTADEQQRLANALRGNAEQGKPLHMDPLTTGWRPGEDETTTDELIDAIHSVPVHYVGEPANQSAYLNASASPPDTQWSPIRQHHHAPEVTDAAMKLLGYSGAGDSVLALADWVHVNIIEINNVALTLPQKARFAADAFVLASV